MSQQITIPSALLDGAVRYIEISSLTVKRALDEVDVHRQAQQKAAALRPQVLECMMSAGVVAPSSKEAAAMMLGGHSETLQLLKRAVDIIATLKAQVKTAEADGTGVDPSSVGVGAVAGPNGSGATKVAGDYNSLTDPFVGRKTSFVKESDRSLMRHSQR